MEHYLMLVLMTSLWITGLQIAIQPGMILERPHVFLEKLWPGNPILSCRWCMASVHTLLILVIYNFGLDVHLPLKSLITLYVLTVPANSAIGGSLSLTVFIIQHIFNKKEAEFIDYDSPLEEEASDWEELMGFKPRKINGKSN